MIQGNHYSSKEHIIHIGTVTASRDYSSNLCCDARGFIGQRLYTSPRLDILVPNVVLMNKGYPLQSYPVLGSVDAKEAY